MSTQFALIQLVATGPLNKEYFSNCVEQLACVYSSNNLDTEFHIGKLCDAVREIFIVINLPELGNGMYWKDNLLSYFINKIKIEYDGHTINMSKKYIEAEILKLIDKISNESLLVNLSVEKRKELSKKSLQLIFPLNLSNLIPDVPELLLITSYNGIHLTIDLSKNNLIENYDNIMVSDIECMIKIISVFYDTETRNKLKNI